MILRVDAPYLSSIEVGNERFNVAVEFVQVDVRQ